MPELWREELRRLTVGLKELVNFQRRLGLQLVEGVYPVKGSKPSAGRGVSWSPRYCLVSKRSERRWGIADAVSSGSLATAWFLGSVIPSAFEGIGVMPTFHPSYLLRVPQDQQKTEGTWEDMQKVLAVYRAKESENPKNSGMIYIL